MNKPVSIKVLSREYLMSFVDLDDALNGFCDSRTHEIHIKRTLDPLKMRDIILHEIMHALWEEYAFPARGSEEQVVTFMARALSNFIATNRAFAVRYLL